MNTVKSTANTKGTSEMESNNSGFICEIHNAPERIFMEMDSQASITHLCWKDKQERKEKESFEEFKKPKIRTCTVKPKHSDVPAVDFCIEENKWVCDDCKDTLVNLRSTYHFSGMIVNMDNYCHTHHNELTKANYFCAKCDRVYCEQCKAAHEHQGDIQLLYNFIDDRQVSNIKNQLNEVESKYADNIKNYVNVLEGRVKQEIDSLNNLIKEVKSVCEEKIKLNDELVNLGKVFFDYYEKTKLSLNFNMLRTVHDLVTSFNASISFKYDEGKPVIDNLKRFTSFHQQDFVFSLDRDREVHIEKQQSAQQTTKASVECKDGIRCVCNLNECLDGVKCSCSDIDIYEFPSLQLKQTCKHHEDDFFSRMEKNKGKEKSIKFRKDKNAPKRAISAFFFYNIERRDALRKEQPNLDNKQIISTMCAEWNKLSDEKKKPYVTKAAQDKKRYEEEKKAYEKKKREEKSTTKKCRKEEENEEEENEEEENEEEESD